MDGTFSCVKGENATHETKVFITNFTNTLWDESKWKLKNWKVSSKPRELNNNKRKKKAKEN